MTLKSGREIYFFCVNIRSIRNEVLLARSYGGVHQEVCESLGSGYICL